MTHGCCSETGGRETRRAAAASKPADWLALAASPTFAIMALVTGILCSDPVGMLCSAAHGSPLGGMAVMYLLMSAFHLTPWLKLIRERAPLDLRVRDRA